MSRSSRLQNLSLVLPSAVLVLAVLSVIALTAQQYSQRSLSAQVTPFPDVPSGTLESRSIEFLYRHKIITGFADGTFKPDQTLTRAQATKLLMIVSQREPIAIRNAGLYRDVPDTEWYAPYVLTATIKRLLDGYGDGTFRPNQAVNTVEFLKMMATFLVIKSHLPYSYRDVQDSDWFAKYAGIAVSYELFPDRLFSLEPARLMTRGETAIALAQFLRSRPDLYPPFSSSSKSSIISSSSSSSSIARSSLSSIAPSSSSVSSGNGCYEPPEPPEGCENVCTKGKTCLKDFDCFVRCS